MNNENKGNIIEEKHFTSANYPFTIKPIFSVLSSIIEKSTQRSIVRFVPNDNIRNLLGFNGTTLYEKYNLLPNIADILSIDIFFLETVIAEVLIFKGKRSGILHNWTETVDPRYEGV